MAATTRLSMKEQRNELDQSYWSEFPLPNYVMEEDGREKLESGDHKVNNSVEISDKYEVKGVLSANTFVTNCNDETDSQTPSKILKKTKKKITGLKRFKVFSSMKKTNEKKMDKIKTYDFGQLGNGGDSRSVSYEDNSYLEMNEQLIKNKDTFNSICLTEESTHSIPSNDYDTNNENMDDYSRVYFGRSRSQSTLQSTTISSSSALNSKTPYEGIAAHRSRSFRIQNKKPFIHNRSQSTTRPKIRWFQNTNSSSSVNIKGNKSHDGNLSKSTRRYRLGTNKRPPIVKDFNDAFNTKNVVKSSSILSQPSQVIDEDRYDVQTPGKLLRLRSRERSCKNNKNKPSDSDENEALKPQIEMMSEEDGLKALNNLYRENAYGNMNRENTENDNGTAMSDLSLSCGTNELRTKYRDILSSMRKLQCHPGLENVHVANENQCFCSVSKMDFDNYSDSDESSCGSSTISDDIHKHFVEVKVNPLSLLPSTSSLSSNSEDLTDNEDENEEDWDASEASSSYAGDDASALQLEFPDIERSGTFVPVSNLLTSIKTRLTDCFTPAYGTSSL